MTNDWLAGVPPLYPSQKNGERIVMTSVEKLQAELAVRKRQIGLMSNCLSHIQNSPIAPEPIRIAATAAISGASELTNEIPDA